MISWPFDAKAAGFPTVMRDAGTLVMFEVYAQVFYRRKGIVRISFLTYGSR
jgi:hypothetical protein